MQILLRGAVSLVAAVGLVGATVTAVAAPAPTDRGGRIAYTFNTSGGGFDIASVRADGTDRRRLTRGNDSYQPAFSPSGRWIAFTNAEGADGDIWLMRPSGTGERPLITGPGDQRAPAWSPDGRSIVYAETSSGRGTQLFVCDRADRTVRQITFSVDQKGPFANDPAWSPDGKRIAFESFSRRRFGDSSRRNNGVIATIRTDGTEYTQLTGRSRASKGEPDWSPRGSKIAFSRIVRGTGRTADAVQGLATVRADGTDFFRFRNTGESSPSWAPFGHRLAAVRYPTDDPRIRPPGLVTLSPRGDHSAFVRRAFYIPDADWRPRE